MSDCNCHNPIAGNMPGTEWNEVIMEDLVAKCSARIYSYCYDRVGYPDAEDAKQDTFVAAWTGRHTFDPTKATGGVCGWLTTIAYRTCSKIFAKKRPPVIEIKSAEHATAIVGVPFAFSLAATPAEAVFRATDVPAAGKWLRLTAKLDANGKKNPNAEQRLEGLPLAACEFVFFLSAEYEGRQATQEFTLLVTDEDRAAEAVVGETTPGWPRRDKVIARVEFDSSEDSTTHLPEERTPILGAKEDVEWLLAHLDQRACEVIYRTYWRDQSVDEIAAALGESYVNVTKIRSRAMAKMRLIMGEEMSHEENGGPTEE